MAPEPTGATTLDGPTDRELLAAHVDGDADAFGELFRRHRDRLWAVALRTTHDREVAADGLQDAMVAAFRRAGSYRGESAVTTWLHRVVVNACLDRLRAGAVRRADPLPDDAVPRGTLVAAATDLGDPVEHAVGVDRRTRVLDALAALPHEQRAALVLVDMEGYPVAEAAELLGCAVGTVKSRCHRGRSRLADVLRDLVEDADDDVIPVSARNSPAVHDVPSSTPSRAPPAEGD